MGRSEARLGVFRTKPVATNVTLPTRVERPREFGSSRNLACERKLCEAITTRRLVEFRYEGDVAFRLFAPHAVYYSTPDRVSISGAQLQNPGDLLASHTPRVFGVATIRGVRITSHQFSPDPGFSRCDPRYKKGIIRSV